MNFTSPNPNSDLELDKASIAIEERADPEHPTDCAGLFGNALACLWFCAIGLLASLGAAWERVKKALHHSQD